MIISIRGTNGSGKSTIVRKLVAGYLQKKIYGILGARLPEAYFLVVPKVAKPVYVLGPYENTAVSGCDQVQPYDLILDLIEKYARRKEGHVVFEGVILSSSYGRVGRLMEEWGQEAVMAFLDTPLETCLKNVQARRDTKKNAKPFNPKNTTSKFEQIYGSRQNIIDAGTLRVVDISMDTGYDTVLKLLKEAI